MDTHPAAVAGTGAVFTTAGLIQRHIRIIFDPARGKILFAVFGNHHLKVIFGNRLLFTTIGAQPAGQPLGHNTKKSIGEIKRIEIHIQKPRNGFGRTIGVQR